MSSKNFNPNRMVGEIPETDDDEVEDEDDANQQESKLTKDINQNLIKEQNLDLITNKLENI